MPTKWFYNGATTCSDLVIFYGWIILFKNVFISYPANQGKFTKKSKNLKQKYASLDNIIMKTSYSRIYSSPIISIGKSSEVSSISSFPLLYSRLRDVITLQPWTVIPWHDYEPTKQSHFSITKRGG